MLIAIKSIEEIERINKAEQSAAPWINPIMREMTGKVYNINVMETWWPPWKTRYTFTNLPYTRRVDWFVIVPWKIYKP